METMKNQREIPLEEKEPGTKSVRRKRSTPISITRTLPPFSEHHYRVPPEVFDEIDAKLAPYKLTPSELLNARLEENADTRLDSRPEASIKFTLLRLEHKLTQSQMAHRLGTDLSRVGEIERGVSGISKRIAARLAEEFGVKEEDFYSSTRRRGK